MGSRLLQIFILPRLKNQSSRLNVRHRLYVAERFKPVDRLYPHCRPHHRFVNTRHFDRGFLNIETAGVTEFSYF